MSNFDINKFKNKDKDLFEDFASANVADENISYKRNKQHPIIFENEDFTDLDTFFFSHLYLEGVHFKQCVFDALESENTIFHNCSFEYCSFTKDVVIKHSTFREKCLFTNIANITFINVLLEEAIFTADIISCNFNDSNLHTCNFKTVNLIENTNFHTTVIQDSSVDLSHSFDNIIFNFSYFDLCSFEQLTFVDTRFHDTSITHSEFNNVAFVRTEEQEDEDDEKSIIKITEDEHQLLNFTSNRFNYCDLRYIDIHHVNFQESQFRHTQMPLVLNFCNFEKSIFAFSTFSDGEQDENFPDEQTSFFHVVNFKNAIFQRVLFKRNDMNEINFRNAIFDDMNHFENGIMVKTIFGLENDQVTRNINFSEVALVHCLFRNEIRTITFKNCDIENVWFKNNTEFNEAEYRRLNNIKLENTEGPGETYSNNQPNIFDFNMEYMNDEDEDYEIQIEAEKQRVTDVIDRAIDIEYEIPESDSIPEQSIFPQEDDESFKIFDIIEGEIVMDENFINTFMTEYPKHKLIIKKQPNNWYPYLIDMDPISKFLTDLTSEKRNESSYLSNIIFICDDQINTSTPPNDTKINEYLSHTAYLKMNFFGIQGVLIPLRDIFSLMNPQNINKKIFIIENIIYQDEIKGLLSLSYAVNYQSSVNCTNKETITVGELHYFYEWKEMLRTLTTPISNRAESTNTQINTSDSFFSPINPDNAGNTVNTVNTESYQADNEDNEDNEIIKTLTRLREDEPFQRNTRQRRGGKTKRKYKVHKNKKTKKNKNKKKQ
tara:strand:+ start:1102 stop:3417 length:2316 start_codon:yes stop_codon:yes gene_type:complete